MEENVSFLNGTHPESSFDMVMRGYHRAQVEEYVASSSQLVASLEAELTTARADVERAQHEYSEADREVERLRALVAEPKPAHEEVSGRLSQILGLATEEADQKRATADAETAELRREADEHATRLLADADTEAKRLVDEARQTAGSELSGARETAERELGEARDEADRLRLASLRQAQELLDQAQRRAGAVDEVSARRLEVLAATHGDAVIRLGQIRDVLAEVLQRDGAAGSLASVVDAVVAQDRQEPSGPLQESSEGPEAPEPGAVMESAVVESAGELEPSAPARRGRR